MNRKIYKRWPPFSRKLADAISSRQQLYAIELFLFIGEFAWQKAKNFKRRIVLVLPPERDDPSNFDWSVINNREALVFCTSLVAHQFLRKLAFELLMAGSSIVRIIGNNYRIVAIFRHDRGQV